MCESRQLLLERTSGEAMYLGGSQISPNKYVKGYVKYMSRVLGSTKARIHLQLQDQLGDHCHCQDVRELLEMEKV